MNKLEVKHVAFMGADLMAAKDESGTIWAGVSYICNGLGLNKAQKDNQIEKIRKDSVLLKGCRKFPAGVFDPNNIAYALKIFDSPEFGSIRTIEEDGKVLFCGSDVAKALGYAKPQNAIDRHCKGALKRGIGVQTGIKADGTPATQIIEMLFIPEGDVYRLAAKSELPGADRFESWIFDEVIPSIRKTGGYISGQNELSPDELMAKALMVAQKTLAEREARISELTVQNTIMQPKADYFDELVDRNLLTSFRDTAKAFNIPQNTFIDFLIKHKYVYRDKKGKLMAYAEKNDGLFELKECFNEKTGWSGAQTMITPKGRETFRLLCEGLARV